MFFRGKKKDKKLVFPLTQSDFDKLLIFAKNAHYDVFFENERGQRFLVKEKSNIKPSSSLDNFFISEVI